MTYLPAVRFRPIDRHVVPLPRSGARDTPPGYRLRVAFRKR
ncbi:hypothetical protein [Sphingomonas sp. AP4-R1]|nr:hypothetical protein [Sphingomonas sp. AP4-R1]